MRYCTACHAPYQGDERFCPVDGAAVVDGEAAGTGDPLIGVKLADRYLVRRVLGRGGMGVVYEAEHVGLEKRVAVKVLLDMFSGDREVLARFHQEARTASRIGHEHIVDISDIGEHEGRSFIVMELLEGQDLGTILREQGALPPERALRIVRQICRALEAAHKKGIIHRDMKPENVFVTQRHGGDFVKLMDFGISKIKAAHDSHVRLTQTGAVIGTPLYMAPEQALGRTDIDHRADVYAVGVMFFEMLCGRPPFTAPTYMALLTQHLHERPPTPRSVRPDVPRGLEPVILKALEKEPARRWSSVSDLAAALPEGPSTGAPARRSARGLWLGAAVAAAALAVAIWWLIPSGDDRPSAVAPGAVPAPDAAAVEVAALSPYGVLEIETRPAGARVFLDGAERGITPLRLRDVPAGERTLRLELEGYVAVEVPKFVPAGREETFFALLVPAREDEPRAAGRRRGRRGEARPEPGAAPTREPFDATPRKKDPEPRPAARDPEPQKSPRRSPPDAAPRRDPTPGKKPNPYD